MLLQEGIDIGHVKQHSKHPKRGFPNPLQLTSLGDCRAAYVILTVTNVVIPDELRFWATNWQAPGRYLPFEKSDLSVVVFEPLFGVRSRICPILPLDRMEVEIGVDRDFDGIVIADDCDTPIKVLAVAVVHFRMKNDLKRTQDPRRERAHETLSTMCSASSIRSSPETNIGNRVSRICASVLDS